jgi:diguanylate cyclase (GGDEF)-like protein
MQVFISWSGKVSREVAEILASFIQHVVRGVNTFVSTNDIDAGERWEFRVSEELERTHHAILCITRDNQSSPWLNYEAGALGKQLGRSRVIPYTLGFPPGEMQVGPLSRLQGVENNEGGTWALVRTLNRAMPSPNDEGFIREDFDLWWPRLQQKMSEALAEDSNATERKGPSDRELLLEMRQDIQRLLDHVSNRRVTDIRAETDALEESLRDHLTGLANRRAFIERASEFAAANAPYVIGILDLDDFKQINDTLGHAKGDELLTILGSAIKEHLSSADIMARVGGDEFAAIFRGAPPETVVKMLAQLIATLPRYATEAGFPAITASGGVSSDRIEPTELKLRDVDRAMYQAKTEGKTRVKLVD